MRARRVDANHAEIVEAYRRLGCSARSTAPLGDGFPDIAVGYGGLTALPEARNVSATIDDALDQYSAGENTMVLLLLESALAKLEVSPNGDNYRQLARLVAVAGHALADNEQFRQVHDRALDLHCALEAAL